MKIQFGLLPWILVLFASSGFTADLKTTRTQLTGTWILQSFLVMDSTGHQNPWCDGVYGLLSYSKDGYMAAAINCTSATEKSPSHKSGDKLLYAGKFNIIDGPSVVHHVMNASQNDIIGTDLVRKISHLDQKSLILTGNFGGEFVITWRKSSAAQ